MAPTAGRDASKVAMAAFLTRSPPVFAFSRARARRSSSFSFPPSRQEPGTRTSSRTTSAVWEARMPCFLNFWPWESPGCPADDEGGVPLRAQVGVHDGHHHVHTGDAAVRHPGLGAVDHPFVLGLVVDGAGAHRGDVGARVGLGGAEGGHLHVVGVSVHLRDPGPDLLLGAVGEDAHGGEAGADDGQGDARVPQKSSSMVIGMPRPVGSKNCWA